MALTFPRDDIGWISYVQAVLDQHETDIKRLWKRTQQTPAEYAGVAHLGYGQQLYGSTTGSRSTTTTVDGRTTTTPDGFTTTTPFGVTTTPDGTTTTTTPAGTTTTAADCSGGGCSYQSVWNGVAYVWNLVGDICAPYYPGCHCSNPPQNPADFPGQLKPGVCGGAGTTTTTTTTPNWPCTGICTYTARIVFGTTVSLYWSLTSSDCSGDTPCNCQPPGTTPSFSGEIHRSDCSGSGTTTTPQGTTTTCGTCAGNCTYLWVTHDVGVGYWQYIGGTCGGGCFCNPPTQGGGYPGQLVESPCRNCETSQGCIGDCKWYCKPAPIGTWEARFVSTTCSPGTGETDADCRCKIPDPSACTYEGQQLTTGCWNPTP